MRVSSNEPSWNRRSRSCTTISHTRSLEIRAAGKSQKRGRALTPAPETHNAAGGGQRGVRRECGRENAQRIVVACLAIECAPCPGGLEVTHRCLTVLTGHRHSHTHTHSGKTHTNGACGCLADTEDRARRHEDEACRLEVKDGPRRADQTLTKTETPTESTHF